MSRQVRTSLLAVAALVVCGSSAMYAHAAEAAEQVPPPLEVGDTNRTRVGIAFRPDILKYFPAVKLKPGQTVKVRVRACYDTSGKVTEATIAESSGIKKIDAAALKFARDHKLRPGTVDGVLQTGCTIFPPVTFSNDPPPGLGVPPAR